MEIDFAELFAMFTAEAEEILSGMEDSLLQLERQPDDTAIVDVVFRGAHTLKGNSASLGFTELSAFAHELENVLDLLRKRQIRADDEVTTLLLTAVDVTKEWVPRLVLGQDNPPGTPARRVQQRLAEVAGATEQSADGGPAEASAGHAAEEPQGRSGRASTIRVATPRMDALLNLTGEAAVAAARLRRCAEELPAGVGAPSLEAMEDFERVLHDLHDTVMRCRMVPLGPIFRRHVRTVRDLATAKAKQVVLRLEGEEVEVDLSVVEALADPLVHLIRNAVDHGIESPDARIAAGKPAEGVITLRAAQERGTIVIQISDDGGGVRGGRIRARAEEMGLPLQGLTEDEVRMLIFEPGFSTAEKVTDTSGRGVGMDVVRRNVERVRGRISLDSREGEGTTVTVRLPLTLAVIPGLILDVGGEAFVIQMSGVEECLLRPAEVPAEGGSGVMHLRGEAVPWARLRHYLGFAGEPDRAEMVVIVDHHDGRAGLLVDAVVGETDVVIKPVSALLRNLPAIAGTAIMATGAVALVLDSAAIFKELERSAAA